MKTTKILISFLMFVIASSISYSFQANSSNFDLSTGTISSGGDIINSDTYKNYVVTGGISGTLSSSSFKNSLGFFYTWLLADGQACTADNQCSGSFCCSSSCSNAVCPLEAEAAEEAAAAAGGAGAGGGGGALPVKKDKDFTVSIDTLKKKLVLGESSEEKFIIRNTGRTNLTISLTIEGVNEFLSLSDNVLDLGPGEEAEVTLRLIGKNIGGFAGQLIVEAEEIVKSIPIILEIRTESVFFDVQLDIPAEYSKVEQGSELRTQITLLSIGFQEEVDVFVTYFIKDFKGNDIYEETETVTIQQQASFLKSFKIDDDIELGNYVVVAEVRFADSFAVSSQIFEIIKKKEIVELEGISRNTILIVFLATILIATIIVLVYRLISISRKKSK